MNSFKIVIYIFLILLIGFVSGFATGYVYQGDFSYKQASIMTCNYANTLTNITNLCSATLKTYTNMNYQVLNSLNCSALLNK